MLRSEVERDADGRPVSPAAEQKGDADVRAYDEAGLKPTAAGAFVERGTAPLGTFFQAVPTGGEQTDAERRSRSGVGVISGRPREDAGDRAGVSLVSG